MNKSITIPNHHIKKINRDKDGEIESIVIDLPPILQQMKTEQDIKIGMLRQWLNEDRITDSKKMVTNEDIKHWLS